MSKHTNRSIWIYISVILLVILGLILILPSTANVLVSFGLDGMLGAKSILLFRIIGVVACILLALLILFQKQVRSIAVALINLLTQLSRTKYLVGLLTIAFLLRVAWLIAIPTVPYTDYKVYHGLACNVAQGKGYIDDFSNPATDDYGRRAWRPPGFPILLAMVYKVTGCNFNVGKFLILVSGLAVVLLSYTTTSLALGERAGRLAGLMIALYPTQIFSTGLLGTELPFTCILLLALYGAIRQSKEPNLKWLIMIGLSMGIDGLMRTDGLIALAAFSLYWLIDSRDLFKTIVYTAIVGVLTFAVILPWSLRNQHVFGTFVLVSTNGGNVMWEGTQTGAAGDSAEGGRVLCVGLTETDCDRYLRTQAVSIVLADPVGYIRYGGVKIVRFYGFGYEALMQSLQSTADGFSISSGFRLVLLAISQSYHMAVLLLALIGMAWSLRRRWLPVHVLFLFILLEWTVLHFFFQGESRYLVPVLPLISGFAALSLASITNPVAIEKN